MNLSNQNLLRFLRKSDFDQIKVQKPQYSKRTSQRTQGLNQYEDIIKSANKQPISLRRINKKLHSGLYVYSKVDPKDFSNEKFHYQEQKKPEGNTERIVQSYSIQPNKIIRNSTILPNQSVDSSIVRSINSSLVIDNDQKHEMGSTPEDLLREVHQRALNADLINKNLSLDQQIKTLKVNFEYFMHHTQMCICFICQCGLCKCDIQTYKPQNFEESPADPPPDTNNRLKALTQDNYESLPHQFRFGAKSPDQYHTIKQMAYRRYGVQMRPKVQYAELQQLPFIGTTSYQNTYVNWCSSNDNIIMNRPKDQYIKPVGLNTFGQSDYQRNYRSSGPSDTMQASDIKKKQEHTTFMMSYPHQFQSSYNSQNLRSEEGSPSHKVHVIKRLKELDISIDASIAPLKQTVHQASYRKHNNPNCPGKDMKYQVQQQIKNIWNI